MTTPGSTVNPRFNTLRLLRKFKRDQRDAAWAFLNQAGEALPTGKLLTYSPAKGQGKSCTLEAGSDLGPTLLKLWHDSQDQKGANPRHCGVVKIVEDSTYNNVGLAAYIDREKNRGRLLGPFF